MAKGFKTKKALLKRIKVTGGNKLLKRRPGQNHFNSKDSGNDTRGKRGDKHAPESLMRDAKALLHQI